MTYLTIKVLKKTEFTFFIMFSATMWSKHKNAVDLTLGYRSLLLKFHQNIINHNFAKFFLEIAAENLVVNEDFSGTKAMITTL